MVMAHRTARPLAGSGRVGGTIYGPKDPTLKTKAAKVITNLVGDNPEWQERALCSQTDPEAFFPVKGGSTREAKRICSRCEVRGDCLEYALGNNESFGIWGGTSERERRKLKRRAA